MLYKLNEKFTQMINKKNEMHSSNVKSEIIEINENDYISQEINENKKKLKNIKLVIFENVVKDKKILEIINKNKDRTVISFLAEILNEMNIYEPGNCKRKKYLIKAVTLNIFKILKKHNFF
jgi:hypothetical protein